MVSSPTSPKCGNNLPGLAGCFTVQTCKILVVLCEADDEETCRLITLAGLQFGE
jgi:hypothetical protein